MQSNLKSTRIRYQAPNWTDRIETKQNGDETFLERSDLQRQQIIPDKIVVFHEQINWKI